MKGIKVPVLTWLYGICTTQYNFVLLHTTAQLSWESRANIPQQGAHPVTTTNARADILTVLQDLLLLSDASVTHCCADTYVERAAATAGSAAEVRAQKKVRKYALHGPGRYNFTPLVVESCDRQCTATHALLNKLGHLTVDSGRVTKGAWIEGALRSARGTILCSAPTSSLTPPCPLALLVLSIATVVPAGSLFGVVFAGCAAPAFLVPEEHLR